MPTLREIYRSQQAAKEVKATKAAPAPTTQQVLAATPALPTEKQTREGAMRVAQCMQQARPQKVIVVFNLFGTHRWFVRSFKEQELRQFLAESKQTKPNHKTKEQP